MVRVQCSCADHWFGLSQCSHFCKDASSDVLTAATVTAAAPADTAETATGAQPTIQLTQVEWQAVLARLALLEQLPVQLTEAHNQLKALQTEMTAAAARCNQQIKEQVQNGIARENAVKDSCQQQVSALGSTQEVLSQRIRSKNMVVHGFPDTAAVSDTAALECMVKTKFDSVATGASISQSITVVTRIGRPGAGNRVVLVEYSSSQAKHRTYALSRQLR